MCKTKEQLRAYNREWYSANRHKLVKYPENTRGRQGVASGPPEPEKNYDPVLDVKAEQWLKAKGLWS